MACTLLATIILTLFSAPAAAPSKLLKNDFETSTTKD